MGNYKTKQEDKEIIIAQNTAGSNAANNSDNIHMTYTNNILLSTIMALVACGVLYYIYTRYKRSQKRFIQREINATFVRRIQMRLSGRKATQEGDNTDVQV